MSYSSSKNGYMKNYLSCSPPEMIMKDVDTRGYGYSAYFGIE